MCRPPFFPNSMLHNNTKQGMPSARPVNKMTWFTWSSISSQERQPDGRSPVSPPQLSSRQKPDPGRPDLPVGLLGEAGCHLCNVNNRPEGGEGLLSQVSHILGHSITNLELSSCSDRGGICNPTAYQGLRKIRGPTGQDHFHNVNMGGNLGDPD